MLLHNSLLYNHPLVDLCGVVEKVIRSKIIIDRAPAEVPAPADVEAEAGNTGVADCVRSGEIRTDMGVRGLL